MKPEHQLYKPTLLYDAGALTKMWRRRPCVISVPYISASKFTCAAIWCFEAMFYRRPGAITGGAEGYRYTEACFYGVRTAATGG